MRVLAALILAAAALALTAPAGAAEPWPDLAWTTDPPLDLPVIDEPRAIHLAYKNPSVVVAKGGWHVLASRKCWVAGQVRHSLVYLGFPDPAHAAEARVVPLLTDAGYASAPCLFQLRAQGTWYAVYGWTDPRTQVQGPAFSTFADIDRPETMTPPVHLFPGVPASLPRKKGVRWLDFTVIGDGERMYLFFTDDGGNFLRSSTTLADFPRGWDDPVVVLQRPTSELFEASGTYRLAGDGRYLTMIEALGPDGTRFYSAWLADRLDGSWTPLRTTAERPFAGSANVRSVAGAPGWARHISHGELLRTDPDERMTVDPAHLTFLYQGWDGVTRVPGIPMGPLNGYHQIPYRLALLHGERR